MAWKRYPGLVLIALLVIHVLAHVDRNILLGFSPQVIRDLGLSHAQYGLLVGAVWVLSFGAMAVFMGSLADRFSRPRVIAAGLLLWSACTAASGLAQDFGHMVAARFLVASGEAALVPAAVGLLAELYAGQKRGTAMGLFFMGIPLGVGCSFLLAGTFGETHGWRTTFLVLGAIGAVIATPLALLREDRTLAAEAPRGEPFGAQVRAVLGVVAGNRTLQLTLIAFVLVHMLFVGLSFAQLWLTGERGLETAVAARTMGTLTILFGALGSAAGGVLGDRFARRFASGHAGFMVLLVCICAPFMIAYRFAPAGSALFYVGMCAGFFLPLACYGPANALIQGIVPVQMRSTIAGFTMLLINVFALALGSLVAGAASDHLRDAGVAAPLTRVLLTLDFLAISAVVFLVWVARRARTGSGALAPA